MQKKEYLEKHAEITGKYRADIDELMREYALSNSPIKVGDMATDHIGTIKVDHIRISTDFNGNPICIYMGLCYTKAGKPFKSGEERPVYQSNLKEEITKKA